MKIYTKKGDKGKTQLLGGSVVDKSHSRLECYGSIDELNAHIGNLYDQKISARNKTFLLIIQNQLFNLGSIISSDGKKTTIKLPEISNKDIHMIEKEIDRIDTYLPKLNAFILPSGKDTCSKCHIARTVCRRAERNLVALTKESEIKYIYIKYLNRLSDYLFVLARDILFTHGVKEVEWQKNK